jgi:hypothetical protein
MTAVSFETDGCSTVTTLNPKQRYVESYPGWQSLKYLCFLVTLA